MIGNIIPCDIENEETPLNGDKSVIKDMISMPSYSTTINTSTDKLHDFFTLNNGRDNNDMSFQGVSGKIKVTSKYHMGIYLVLGSSVSNNSLGGSIYINGTLVKTLPQRTVGQWTGWVNMWLFLEEGDVLEIRCTNSSSYAWYLGATMGCYKAS